MATFTNETIAEIVAELNLRCNEPEQLFYFWAFIAVVALVLVPFLIFLMLSAWLYFGLRVEYESHFPHYKAIPQVIRTGPWYYLAFYVPEAIIFNGLPYFLCASTSQRMPLLFAAALIVYNLCAFFGFWVLWVRQNGLFKRSGGFRDRLNRKEAWPYLFLGGIAMFPIIAVLTGACIFVAAVNDFEARGENLFVNHEFCALAGQDCVLEPRNHQISEYLVVQVFPSGLYSLDIVESLPTGGRCVSSLITPSFCVRDSRVDFLSLPYISDGYDIVPVIALIPIIFLPFIGVLFYAWEWISFHIRL